MQAEFKSLKNKTVRLSILEDALLTITTVQSFHNYYYDKLTYVISRLGDKKRAIRASKEGTVEYNEDICTQQGWGHVCDHHV